VQDAHDMPPAVSVAHRVIYLVTGTYDANAEASHEDDEDHVRPA